MRVKLPSPADPPEERMRVLKAQTLTPVAPIDIFETDEHAMYEIGSPGYRTAPYRSGIGYIESQAEMARLEETMVRWLFTGTFQVNTEPTAFVAMLVLGVYCAAFPLGTVLGLILADGTLPLMVILGLAAPETLVGVFALLSGIASISAVIRKSRWTESPS